MNPRIIDAVMSLWTSDDPEEEHGFVEIHKALVSKGIVQKLSYRYKTARILHQICALKLLKKVRRGAYHANVQPTEFRVFDYLQTLRKTNQVTRGQVGGTFWKSHEMYFLGMPDTVFQDKVGNYALQILNIRLAELFNAFQALAIEMRTRKERQEHEDESFGLPPMVVRQLLLELLPYYLGSRAGLDFDGLNSDELNVVLPKMIKALPEKIGDDQGWIALTQRKAIMEDFHLINQLNLINISKKKQASSEDEDEDARVEKRYQDFALIVTGPEHLIDSHGYAQRWIRDDIVEHGNEDESPFYLAHFFLDQQRQHVLEALKIYGRRHLGRKKCSEVQDAYEKLYAANWLAEVMSESHDRAFLEEPPFDKKEKSWIDENISKITNDFGVKALITYLPFSHCLMPFVHPTLEKEKIIQQFFPQVPAENIHQWLGEGAALASDIFERTWKNSQKKRETATSPA